MECKMSNNKLRRSSPCLAYEALQKERNALIPILGGMPLQLYTPPFYFPHQLLHGKPRRLTLGCRRQCASIEYFCPIRSGHCTLHQELPGGRDRLASVHFG